MQLVEKKRERRLSNFALLSPSSQIQDELNEFKDQPIKSSIISLSDVKQLCANVAAMK